MQGDESGGSEPQVLADVDGRFWMVEAPNQRQGPRVPASELIAGILASRVGAAVPEVAVCILPGEVTAAVTLSDGQPWAPGEAFGSSLLDSAAPYVPAMHATILNRDSELLLVVAIDTWLAAYGGRQARVLTDSATGHYGC
jgi:hypothetical protein